VLVHLDSIHGMAEALIALRSERRFTVAEIRERVIAAFRVHRERWRFREDWMRDLLTRAFPDEA
jgi:hypothetical protein